MIKYRAFLGTCLTCLLMACVQTTGPKTDFGPEIPLQHTVRNPEIYASFPEGFFRLDSLLAVLSPRIGDNFGRLISLKTFQEVGTFGIQGKGPTEVLWTYPFACNGNDNSFRAYDLPSRSAITYTLQKKGDTLTMRGHDKRRVDQGDVESQANTKLCRIGEDHYMGQCFHAQDQYFSLLDKDFNQIGYFGDSPIPEPITNASDRLQGRLADGYNMAVYIPIELPYIGCYGMKDGQPVKLWEDNFSDMIYQVNGTALVYKPKETKGRTYDVMISKEHIYVLWYDGLLYKYYNRPENTTPPGATVVFVYDHQGNRKGKFRLDVELCKAAISEDEQTLYGLTTPEYSLVTFDLPAE